MDFLYQIKLSFLFYWRAFRFIDGHNLWKLLIIPALITLIITIIIIVFAIKTSGIIVDHILTNFQLTSPDRSVHKFIEGTLMVVVRTGVFFLYLKAYRYLILVLLAPIFAIISSKTQIIDSGQHGPSDTKKYLWDCCRGVALAVRNFIIEIIASTLIIAISLIVSWIIPLAPLFILLLESYFMGFCMADYRNEHYNLGIKESRKLNHHYFGLVLGNGFFFNLFLLIPILGVLFAPTMALVASGLSINHLEKRKSILCDSDQSTPLMAKS